MKLNFSKSIIFFLASIALSFVNMANAEECPVTKAAVVSTAGDSNGVGKLSQSFLVPPRL